ncbi:AAA family ATPase [Bifidobacterium asteroides]|uniref:AAA family ATPase n=1 Tax=Bifidobacterium asteroides TaxID=1684 RepID=UPI002741C11B|nr:AAA family ATPase [Bifidobacterium asteroides]WLT11067.1 AAA family ATPase [Bifidobacterium asteroides]
MKLTKVQLHKYKSIDDSTAFDVQTDVTCLVGKNESGKTAALEAMYKSRPISNNVKFDMVMDYPTHLTRERKESGRSQIVSDFAYELDEEDIAAVEKELGPNTVISKTMTCSTRYDQSVVFGLKIDTLAVKNNLLKELDLSDTVKSAVQGVKTPQELVSVLEEKVEGDVPSVQNVIHRVKNWRDLDATNRAFDILNERRPKFVYYEDYDIMPGLISIPYLIKQKEDGNLTRGQKALIALIRMAGIDLEELEKAETANYENIIRELENASNVLSDEVFEYWSQNQELSVVLKLLPGVNRPERLNEQGPLLQIRISNQRHKVTVPLSERSRGFIWFFSFLAYFSDIEDNAQQPLILLLDEPGLSLHATAQQDLLRFIRERLAPTHQVIYTTHSPFMVDAHKFNQVRTVIDADNTGTVVSSDVLKADKESVFPLHAAMGVQLTQTLFIGPYVLFVEGPSDLIYLNYLSDAVSRSGGQGLDTKWTITPGGGLAKIPFMLNLYGANDITIAVLTDSSKQDKSVLNALRQDGRIFNSSLVSVGDILDKTEADIEDIFTPEYYLNLVSRAYAGMLNNRKIKVQELPRGNRIVKRVELYFQKNNINKGRLNHYSPAAVLLRASDELPQPDRETLQNAEELFKRINSILQ